MKSSMVISLFLLAASITTVAQEQQTPGDSALVNFKNLYPQEKVFVQTDKEFYISGETMWMKAWCSLDGAPTFLSKIVYVDLVNAHGEVVLKKMYLLDSLSSAAADFELPETLTTGTYALNAYSLWMLNFPNYVFRKNVFIYGNDYSGKGDLKKNAKPSINLLFFPEGGDIISGVENRIAFKATDGNGYPFSFKGKIEDRNGKKVADIFTEHDGMGMTGFLFEDGNEYTAMITLGDGKSSLSYKLPKPKNEGVAFKIENSNPNKLFVLLNRTEKGKEKYKKVKVVAVTNYQVVLSKTLDLDLGETAITINKKNLPPGILHITLFDSNNMPLAERISFVENYEVAKPVIALELKDLKPKAKNQVSFSIADVEAPSLSCMVSSYFPSDSAGASGENIGSSFLITSDLKGYIHNPGYYFKNKNTTTLHHLDLLLMTQGWRRFEWSKIQRNAFPAITYPVESAISFRGSVFKSDSKEVIKDGKVSFIIKGIDSTSILAEANLTDKGEFFLSNVNYVKKALVAYMGTNNKKENFIVDVKLLPNYIDSLKSSSNKPFINLDTADINNQKSALSLYLNKSLNIMAEDSRAQTLGNVTVKARKLAPIDSLNNAYAGGAFLMGKSIDPTTFKNYRTIWQMIQAAVPGVSVEGNPFDPSVRFNRFIQSGSSAARIPGINDDELSESGVIETGGVAYFLNEVNVTKDVINTLSVDDVALIKVLKNEAAALGATEGAIAVYTKQDVSTRGNIYDKAYTKSNLEGYAVAKEFYNPDYTFDPALKESDNRYTLFWSGKLAPAKDGKFRFQFYNNSIGTKARIVIQGMDKTGQLIYQEMIIE